MPSQLAKDNTMKLEASANVMGVVPMQTNWFMLLNSPDANFKVTGDVAPFPISVLSPPFEALSMTSIRSGFADKLNFEINGQRMSSTGNVLLNYHDLKIDLLKKNKGIPWRKKGFSVLLPMQISGTTTSQQSLKHSIIRKTGINHFSTCYGNLFLREERIRSLS
jgi:hypothetical protein